MKTEDGYSKYAFIRIDESGVKISLSDSLAEFETFSHYGLNPKPKDLEVLEQYGVVGWTGNDVWYYIMCHDTWRYMDLDLRIEVGKAILGKSISQ